MHLIIPVAIAVSLLMIIYGFVMSRFHLRKVTDELSIDVPYHKEIGFIDVKKKVEDLRKNHKIGEAQILRLDKASKLITLVRYACVLSIILIAIQFTISVIVSF